MMRVNFFSDQTIIESDSKTNVDFLVWMDSLLTYYITRYFRVFKRSCNTVYVLDKTFGPLHNELKPKKKSDFKCVVLHCLCLPQNLKNVDFSPWGKLHGPAKMDFFPRFSSLCMAMNAYSITRGQTILELCFFSYVAGRYF